jgi:hypothetical protein
MNMNRLLKISLLLIIIINIPAPLFSQIPGLYRKKVQPIGSRNPRSNPKATESSQFECLSKDFQLSDIVSYRRIRKSDDKQITIEDKLAELKARCKAGKLIDSEGREIRFFRLSCFGNPPENIDEIVQKERQTLDTLKKKYHVVVIGCDPHIN